MPGVTQCPIAPGDTLTYKFQATQYGTTWYHSHFSLQYADGLFGPLIINGPATADYDEDLGVMFLGDWAHQTVFDIWDAARAGTRPSLQNTLMNGTNSCECDTSDPKCVGGGKKFEAVFVEGQKYRIRLINVGIDSHFEFAIDGHTLTVIANDLVPIVPYTTDTLLIGIGQRYDVIVEANATPDNYWIRGNWGTACAPNLQAANATGILRYNSSSTAEPTSVGVTPRGTCADEPLASLVPHLAMDVGSYALMDEKLDWVRGNILTWTINSSSLVLDWTNPTTLQVFRNESLFPTDYNVVPINKEIANGDDWIVYVIEDLTHSGTWHPMHLHGHDFFIVGQEAAVFDPVNTPATFNLNNPPRRDVAALPAGGYLAIAFKLDNPGSWLLHCHIAWHASEGLAMQFVESESSIAIGMKDTEIFDNTCKNWNAYVPTEVFPQDDSGI